MCRPQLGTDGRIPAEVISDSTIHFAFSGGHNLQSIGKEGLISLLKGFQVTPRVAKYDIGFH